jgi:signal transduction histidine kinase
LEIGPIDFDKIIDEVWDNFLFMEGAQRIRLEKNIACEEVFSDKGRLLVLLNNLISNAIKYHNVSQQDPWINVSVIGSFKNVKITISDNGLGIGKEHLSRVFDMFYRAHEYSKGSGLGLYIVKEILDKLKGSIRVKSEEREGTMFTIVIPVTSGKIVLRNGQQAQAQSVQANSSVTEEATSKKLIQLSA